MWYHERVCDSVGNECKQTYRLMPFSKIVGEKPISRCTINVEIF